MITFLASGTFLAGGIFPAALRQYNGYGDIGGDEETLLGEDYDTPIMIHRYPTAIKAFYMKRDPKNPKVVLAVDVIGPEGAGEIIGGSEREADYDVLLTRIKEQGLDPEGYSWYLDLRKYGSVPHAGFGMGIERMVRWVCGLQHVRETIPFARMMDKIHP